jgi:hypothetical protein
MQAEGFQMHHCHLIKNRVGGDRNKSDANKNNEGNDAVTRRSLSPLMGWSVGRLGCGREVDWPWRDES